MGQIGLKKLGFAAAICPRFWPALHQGRENQRARSETFGSTSSRASRQATGPRPWPRPYDWGWS